MKILSIVTYLIHAGGIQRHVLDLSASLAARGHKVVLAGGRPSPEMDARSLFDDDTIAFPMYWIAVERVSGFDSMKTERSNVFVRFYHAIKEGLRLRKIIQEQDIELVHAHESAPALIAWIATLGLRVPVVVTYHGSEPERLKEFAQLAKLTATKLITPSHTCAEDLHRIGGVPKRKLKVIGLGVPPAPEIDEREVAARRQELLGDGKLLVVMVARLAYQKGIDIFIRVVKKVSEQNPGIRFAVVGGGDEAGDVRGLADVLDVGDKITWVGISKRPYLYLQAADMFLLTSRWEALPISIVEAFRSGLPVVATQTGGVAELVAPSVGRVVPVGDVDASAQAILEICENDDLRKQMSENAYALAQEDRFCPEHIHGIFEAFYEKLITETHSKDAKHQ